MQGKKQNKGEKITYKTTKAILEWVNFLQQETNKSFCADFDTILRQITSLLFYYDRFKSPNTTEVYIHFLIYVLDI